MKPQLHYAGNRWDLVDQEEGTRCQAEIMSLCRLGGGILEAACVGDVTARVLIGANIPVAILG